VRLGLWGESLGFVPGEDGKEPQINQALDRRPQVRKAITNALLHLQNLLTKADVVTGRYDLLETNKDGIVVFSESTSLGMVVFRDSFRKLRSRMRQNQKEKSTVQVTRWAVHDQAKFRDLLASIRNLIDGLESVTSSLGVLETQRARLIEEIESISDTQSLRMLQSISSAASSGVLQLVSDRASQRISFITSGSRTYQTAPSRAAEPATQSIRTSTTTLNPRPGNPGLEMPEIAEESDIPQNQRWIAALLGKHPKQETGNEFELVRDSEYGRQLATIKEADEAIRAANATKLLVHADGGMPLAQRMFTELRSIRRANVPFLSAAPVQDRLDRLLASVEGPPGTPYEGGIFWITVQLIPQKPPLLRFQTRIYHPNIDCNGNLCADYASWWTDANLSLHMWTREDESVPWFSEMRVNHYSLGALLVAICGLLSSPNIDDPLVPEIAEKHITNYNEYFKTAKLYTERYAKGNRPSENSLQFASTAEPSELLSVPRISAEPSIMTKPASLMGQASTRRAPSIEDTSRYVSERYPTGGNQEADSDGIKSFMSGNGQQDPDDTTDKIRDRIKTTKLPLLAKFLEWQLALLAGPSNRVSGARMARAFQHIGELGRRLTKLEDVFCGGDKVKAPPTSSKIILLLGMCQNAYNNLVCLSKVVSRALDPPLNGWSPKPLPYAALYRLPLTSPAAFSWEQLSKDIDWARECRIRLWGVLCGNVTVDEWTKQHGRDSVGSIASIAEMEYEFELLYGYVLHTKQCPGALELSKLDATSEMSDSASESVSDEPELEDGIAEDSRGSGQVRRLLERFKRLRGK
jgi:ubiquitin-protein ligase